MCHRSKQLSQRQRKRAWGQYPAGWGFEPATLLSFYHKWSPLITRPPSRCTSELLSFPVFFQHPTANSCSVCQHLIPPSDALINRALNLQDFYREATPPAGARLPPPPQANTVTRMTEHMHLTSIPVTILSLATCSPADLRSSARFVCASVLSLVAVICRAIYQSGK